MLVEDPRLYGTLELLRENTGVHPDPWLEPRRSHQLCPFRAVRANDTTVAQVDGNVGDLVTNHLAQQFFGLVEQSRMESDRTCARVAAAEGSAEAWARFDVGSVGEVGKGPGSGPFG